MKESVNTKKSVLLACLLLFTVALGARMVTNSFYLSRYDIYEPVVDASSPDHFHAMVKGDAYIHWTLANKIVEEINNGQHSFLATGFMHHFGSFAYQRIIAIYSLLTGKMKPQANGLPLLGEIGGFLLLQSLLFSLCLIPFYLILYQYLGKSLALGSSLFIALEPTLLQYNSMMLTESLFIAILAIMMAVWAKIFINPKRTLLKNFLLFFLLGFIIGVAFLQRAVAIFIPVIILTILIIGRFFGRIKFSLKIAAPSFLVSYAFVLLMVGLHNYYRAGFFYVFPQGMNTTFQCFLSNKVLATVNQTNPDHERDLLFEKALDAVKKKGFVSKNVINESKMDEQQFYEFNKIRRQVALDVLRHYPWTTIKLVVFNTLKSLTIDPFYTYRLYSNIIGSTNNTLRLLESQQHAKQISLRMVYSAFILLPVFVGWVVGRRILPWPMHWLCTLGIAYFTVTSGWLGFTRGLLPNFVFYAIYWPIGVKHLIKHVPFYSRTTS